MGLLGLQSHGVRGVGRVPEGLPSFTWPDVSLLEHLWPAALGIALMSFTETIAAGRAFATSDEPPPDRTRSCWRRGSQVWRARCWAPCPPAVALRRPR